MVTVVLVEEGNMTYLEGDAMRVRLEAVLLEVPLSTAQVTDMDECAILDLVSLVLAPKAFIAKFVIHPIPWTIDGFLDVGDMVGIE